jgi:hypothetical protein
MPQGDSRQATALPLLGIRQKAKPADQVLSLWCHFWIGVPMICEACLEAGRFNRMANEANLQSTALAEILRVEARKHHKICIEIEAPKLYKGCDCQHLIGDWIVGGEANAETHEPAAPAA